MVLHDAHCHFFSERFFAALGADPGGHGATRTAEEVAAALGWEFPASAEDLADHWIGELDAHGVSRAALMASVPGDEDSVAVAVARHPTRFVGYFAVNPLAPDALEHARRGFTALGLRTVCLFPALHGYGYDHPRVHQIFEIAAASGGVVFGHCGYLSVEARTKLGLVGGLDLRLGNPLTLATTALSFPQVPVIVPHFGAGLFREALMAVDACPSILFDSSSSNSWVKFVPGLTLVEAFKRALAVVGPERILFGTDSSNFPRGWRQVIYGAQRTALDEIGVEADCQRLIFSGNFERLFGDHAQPAGR
jgi:predicted TIM-barrel fold metal-dependent hydrolase